MLTTLRRAPAALALGGLLLLSGALVSAADRPADKIVQEINDLKVPTIDPAKRNDRAAVMAYFTEIQKVQVRKAELIGELYKTDPNNKELVKLLPERWNSLARSGPDKADALLAEIAETTARIKNDGLKAEGALVKASIVLMKDRAHPEAALPAVREFARLAPKDNRAPQILYAIANMTHDDKTKIEIEDQILKSYPNSPYIKSIEGLRRQRAAVGKPFDLEFTEAIHGSSVSIKGLKGKVVVIDFWATWCGPCVAEMPTMKKLYAEYKPKGVEFIGVSLDQPKEAGGLDALKKFVAEKEITWPQYYQGNYWQSEFSTSWGVQSIPCVFVVDADGKLYSTEARGKLETLIPELLKKAHPDPGAGGQ